MNSQKEKQDGRLLRRKTAASYAEEFKAKANGEFELLSDYVKSTKKVKVRHTSCGSEYLVAPSAFLRRMGCQACAHHYQRLTPEQYLERFNQAHQGRYKLLTPYISSKDCVQIEHQACGHQLKLIPIRGLRLSNCPHCEAEDSEHPNQFKTLFEEEFEHEFELRSEFCSRNEKVTIYHSSCGATFEAYPYVFLRIGKCLNCQPIQGSRSFTSETFQLRLNQLYKGNFQLRETYQGTAYKVAVEHIPCGHISHPWGSNLSRGAYRCPNCKKR